MKVVPCHQEFNCAYKVSFMDPGNELTAACDRAAQTAASEPEKNREDASRVGSHHHGRTEGHLAGTWRVGFLLRSFPSLRDVDAEAPVPWSVRFFAAYESGRL